MMLIGLDDTDTLESPGTNQLAKIIVRALSRDWECVRIVRHQLLFDPRVPYTSKNGSASIALAPRAAAAVLDEANAVAGIFAMARSIIRDLAPVGSDPGLCVTMQAAAAVTDFGRRCQQMIVEQGDARRLAAEQGLALEGLGGTEGGVIGALAAVGLAAGGDDGRVVQLGEFAADVSGWQPVSRLVLRGVVVRDRDSCREFTEGFVDVGKKLRPNVAGGRVVLHVERTPAESGLPRWRALKLV